MVRVSRPVLQLKDTMSTTSAAPAACVVGDTQASARQLEYVWTRVHGWRQLTAAELPQAGDAWAWSAERSWLQFDDPEGLLDGAWDASNSGLPNIPTYEPSWTGGWGRGGNGHQRQDKDGDVPEWDGKSMHRTTYFRKIDLWVATTGVEREKQAIRLLQKLSGEGEA